MAHAVQFSKDYNWTAPVPIRSFEVNVALMRWFFTHAQVGGGWVKLDFLSKSDAELGELVRAVPDFGEARRDFRSFRVLLTHLGTATGSRMSKWARLESSSLAGMTRQSLF